MFEEVTCKGDVDLIIGQSAEVGTRPLHNLDARAGVASNLLAKIERNPATAHDMVNKLAIARADIEDSVSVAYIALKKALAQDSPYAVFSISLVLIEPQPVNS